MAKVSIDIEAPWEVWDESAHVGVLHRGEKSKEKVLVRLEQCSVARADSTLRAERKFLVGLKHPAALRLISLSHLPGDDAALAWVYEGFWGVSLRFLFQSQKGLNKNLPLKAALDVVTQVAQLMEAVEEAKPQGGRVMTLVGPTPSDILINGQGELRVAGVKSVARGVQRVSPLGYAAPEGSSEKSCGYQMGALLVDLLTGEPPGAGAEDPARHEATVRRATIRVLARSGTTVPDELMELIRQCLAHDVTSRPDWATIVERCAAILGGLGGEGLVDWATAVVPGLVEVPEEYAPVESSEDAPESSEDAPESSEDAPESSEDAPEQQESGLDEQMPVYMAEIPDIDEPTEELEQTEEYILNQVTEEEPTVFNDVASNDGSSGGGGLLSDFDIGGARERPVVPVTMDLGARDTQVLPRKKEPALTGRTWPMFIGLVLFGVVIVLAMFFVNGRQSETVTEQQVPNVAPALGDVVEEGEQELDAAPSEGLDEGAEGKPDPASQAPEPEPVKAQMDTEPEREPEVLPETNSRTAEPNKDGEAARVVGPRSGAPNINDFEPVNLRIAPKNEPDAFEIITPKAQPVPGEAETTENMTPKTDSAAGETESSSEEAAAPQAAAGDVEETEATSADGQEAATEQPESDATAADESDSQTEEASGASDLFRVEFRSALDSVTKIQVRCHQGEGQGAGTVVIAEAGRGPCKVVGEQDSGESLIVMVSLTGPHVFSCFEEGSLVCQ